MVSLCHYSPATSFKLAGVYNQPQRRRWTISPKPVSLSPNCRTFGAGVLFVSKVRREKSSASRSWMVALRAGDDSPAGACDDGGGGKWRELVLMAGEVLSVTFPMWISLACLLALWRPTVFLWVDRRWQIVGLIVSMLGMGMTLTLDDLTAAILMPKELAAGFVLQYTVMPMSGYLVSRLLRLPSHYAAGLILVSCCPGGTASNVITYLARGNVALSVLMTTASTLTAAVMTPFLTSKLAGKFVAVDPAGLFVSTLQVFLPICISCDCSSFTCAILNKYCSNLVKFLSPLMPLIVAANVAVLCGSVIAQNALSILASGLQVAIAVVALHGLGFFFGYVFSRMMGIDESSSRTISIEVGMQNSLLGLVLAGKHFESPLTAIPCAVSCICHLIYGSVLAGIWRCIH